MCSKLQDHVTRYNHKPNRWMYVSPYRDTRIAVKIFDTALVGFISSVLIVIAIMLPRLA